MPRQWIAGSKQNATTKATAKNSEEFRMQVEVCVSSNQPINASDQHTLQ